MCHISQHFRPMSRSVCLMLLCAVCTCTGAQVLLCFGCRVFEAVLVVIREAGLDLNLGASRLIDAMVTGELERCHGVASWHDLTP
jgi:hypothetical protein